MVTPAERIYDAAAAALGAQQDAVTRITSTVAPVGTAAAAAALLIKPALGDRFHLDVAESLVKTKTDNDQALKQLQGSSP